MDITKVILADINESYLASITDYLHKKGNIEVVAACGQGNELIAKINSLSPDIVIMNLILEDLDGISVLRKCAAQTRRIPFIICSEFSNQNSIYCAQKYGAAGYLCKPVRLDTIYDIITEYTQKTDNGISAAASNGNDCEAYIMDRLAYLGIPAGCAGFPLIVHAVKTAYNDPAIIKSITKTLYPMLAERYSTTACRVERNIRSAIKAAFDRGMMPEANRAPTNKQLIASLSNELRRYL